uniref:Protein serine/threonine phosphatase 2C C-terminal domain-containing protein n=1 Tax=Laticauda laticaudata TaxID=8630 RepID=A0A8C5SPY4_LATLA
MGGEERIEAGKVPLNLSDIELARPTQSHDHLGSRDNMSIVLVCFSNAPKVSDEAMKRDADLDKHLESRNELGNFLKLWIIIWSIVAKV